MELSMTMRTVTADLRWGYSVLITIAMVTLIVTPAWMWEWPLLQPDHMQVETWCGVRLRPLLWILQGMLIKNHENLTPLISAQASRQLVPRARLRLWPGGVLLREVWGVSHWPLHQERQDLHGYKWGAGVLLQWRLSNSNQTMSGTSSVIRFWPFCETSNNTRRRENKN